MGFIANGDWAQYANVDFGSSPAHQISARVASGAAAGVSGLVEVRLDSRSNAPIGSFAIANTGGWQSWRSPDAAGAARQSGDMSWTGAPGRTRGGMTAAVPAPAVSDAGSARRRGTLFGFRASLPY
jgi:carbohydrate binding protein with CBM6 domain